MVRIALRFTAAAVVAALCMLTFSKEAAASPQFPDTIAQTLSIASGPPPCTICHNTLSGGLGTVTKPFGQYMQSRGLVAGNVDALQTALQAMIAERHDTDGDGVTDEDALKAGKDPNPASNSSVPDVGYGCGRVASHAPATGAVWVLAGAVALLARRRRRP